MKLSYNPDQEIPRLPLERIKYYGAWEKFVYDGEISEDIPDSIKQSWQRCAQLKVDPLALSLPRVLPFRELNVRKRRRSNFIKIARSVIKNLYKLVKGSGFTIFLTDEEGVVLLIDGDPSELEKHKRINLIEGAIWTEQEVGTNAVGTAIVTGQPIQVVGGEHYCVTQHEITCSAAPIYGCDHKMVGALNMSGACERVHPHTLGMVVSAAKCIENQLEIKQALEQVVKANTIMKTTLFSVPDGIITLDERENISQLNRKAAQILGVDGEEVIGKNIDQIFCTKPPLSRVVEKGVMMDAVEVAIEQDKIKNRYITVNARPIITEEEQVTGGVIVLRGKETVNYLVNKVTGAQAQFTFHSILGKDTKLEKAKEIARTAALTNSTVLLLGESGTGKELFAQSIHNASHRKGPFIAVNCSAIPRSLIESELFGYEAGTFTGADRNGRPGKFERANGGTIFLDEIGDMPLDLQTILLRVLQERQVVRVGGYKTIPIDVRVIAATNKNLASRVEEGTFREDLYFRLNVVTVNIPPLRERVDDITVLAKSLLPQISSRLGKEVTGITIQALKCLQEYRWPGNVRELENVLERGVIVAQGNLLTIKDIPDYLVKRPLPSQIVTSELLRLVDIEKRAIETTLTQVSNIVEAAKILGISRSTLYRKIKEYNIYYSDD
ncbi:sigma-54-dependent Fis family transcriptional regulator [Desulfitobacterium sp.]|uniref:sigma-54-dependent Fis family transcriptional regulator n=1 Tax=Desulfitobacterium sp. TaxID=49981 RepID=UPI002B21E59C|nr:sigma-54-dependent Fis family transcriptional regulator [Desulfitobacterium sp.]MEA4901592.1 sigma-54-dependent Fis family transcriptional regulator [Desulfitobacterium sp.]